MARAANSRNASTVPASPINQRESSDARITRIHAIIRERIALLRYPPNTVLSEAALAEEFETSRTPIRRVMQRLHHEGLVDIRNGIGTIVTDIDLKTMKDIYDLRTHLAALIGVVAPVEITKSHISALNDLLKRVRVLKKSRNLEEFARLCNDLHEVMISLTASAPLRETEDLFYYRVSRIWFTYLPHLDWNSVAGDQEVEIADILAALKCGDLKAAGEVRRYHYHGLLGRISGYLSGVELPQPEIGHSRTS